MWGLGSRVEGGVVTMGAHCGVALTVWGLGFGVWVASREVRGWGFRVQVQCSGLRVYAHLVVCEVLKRRARVKAACLFHNANLLHDLPRIRLPLLFTARLAFVLSL